MLALIESSAESLSSVSGMLLLARQFCSTGAVWIVAKCELSTLPIYDIGMAASLSSFHEEFSLEAIDATVEKRRTFGMSRRATRDCREPCRIPQPLLIHRLITLHFGMGDESVEVVASFSKAGFASGFSLRKCFSNTWKLPQASEHVNPNIVIM